MYFDYILTVDMAEIRGLLITRVRSLPAPSTFLLWFPKSCLVKTSDADVGQGADRATMGYAIFESGILASGTFICAGPEDGESVEK
ncbi:hypothetical protein Y032_0026g1310 [Ancylostoma ceylanicum]|uniref:Uncharacterized protein n=1 Tax=Ancylostoma ceylanicum TaxID=53326 RepID=A0A016UTC6_9BILA|nr:hypothetical protein Y032_0026g1310 [Ancylostoma ceylanicum]